MPTALIIVLVLAPVFAYVAYLFLGSPERYPTRTHRSTAEKQQVRRPVQQVEVLAMVVLIAALAYQLVTHLL